MAWYRCGLGTPSEVLSLPTPSEASGAIARFNTDLTENLLSAVAEFSASQAEGTPTPASPIPIVGVSAVNFARTEKNLVNVGTQEVTGTYKAIELDAPIPAGTYTLSAKISSTYSTVAARFRKADTSALVAVTLSPASPNRSSVSVTLPEPAYYIYLYSANGQSGYTATWEDVQLEIGSATEYEPYNGTSAIINLGGTYYGGEVDAVTGKITLTHGYDLFDGSEDEGWYLYSTSNVRYAFRVFLSETKKATTTGIEEMMTNSITLRTTSETTDSDMSCRGTTYESKNFWVFAKPSEIADLTALKTFLANTNLQVVYPLAEPIVVYASNTAEIPTLNGDNQVFADSGNIAVKYFETVGHKI